MHKISDIRWVIGRGRDAEVFAHISGGFSSKDGHRQIGDCSSRAVEIPGARLIEMLAGTVADDKFEMPSGPVVETPHGELWAAERREVEIPAEWRPIADAAAGKRTEEGVKYGGALQCVWLSIVDGTVKLAVASDSYVLAFAGDREYFDQQANIPVTADVFKRGQPVKIGNDGYYISVNRERRELVKYDGIPQPPYGETIRRSSWLEEGFAPPLAELKAACANLPKPIGRTSGAVLEIAETTARIIGGNAPWSLETTEDRDTPHVVRAWPEWIRDAVQMSGTTTFQYGSPRRNAILHFDGDTIGVKVMSLEVDRLPEKGATT